MVIDTNSWTRLDGLNRLREIRGLEIHVWDHHSGRGDMNADWSCAETVGSTTTLLVKRLQDNGAKLSSIYATLFLTGKYEDTGNLTFPSTTAKDAKAVGFLLEQNADLNFLKNFLRPPTARSRRMSCLKCFAAGGV